ncbi:hypothetical protein [Nitrosospira multiformis]|uniref:hypothetical protein n=1 Tax=Nitrosospira multiformis TaxID=1231 RepID=UPI000945D4C5|nr:hypothetical protein [Nitrosospira multiformis]
MGGVKARQIAGYGFPRILLYPHKSPSRKTGGVVGGLARGVLVMPAQGDSKGIQVRRSRKALQFTGHDR